MSSARATDDSSVADALGKLQEALRPATSGTTDPDRKRAAQRLSELARAEDEDLARFARRHLPGREVDKQELEGLRTLVLAVARLVGLQGSVPSASALASDVRSLIHGRIDEIEREASAPKVAPKEPEPRPLDPPAMRALPKQPVSGVATRGLSRMGEPPAPPRTTGPAVPPAPVAALPIAAPPAHAPPAAVPPAAVPPAAVPQASVQPPSSRRPIPVVAAPFSLADEQTVTADLSSAAHALRGPNSALRPLPFEPKPPGQPPRAAAPAPAQVAEPPAAKRADPMFETVVAEEPPDSEPGTKVIQTSPGEEKPKLKQTLPFKEGGPPPAAALPPHLEQIDLATHANFAALLVVYPNHHPQIYARLGIRSRAERDLLDRHWLTKLSANPVLGAEWVRRRDEAIAHYRSAR